VSDLAAAAGLPLRDWAARGWRGDGIRIVLLDTGVSPAHAALADALAGYLVTDTLGRVSPDAPLSDPVGHGTFNAGVIHSIAPGADLCVAQVIEGGATLWRLLLGLGWALEQEADIIVLPLGLPISDIVLRPVMGHLRQADILVMGSVGNTGAGRVTSPGALPEVFSVGACADDDLPARFSGSTPDDAVLRRPDLLARGVKIPGPERDGSPTRVSGTSVAVSVAAGAVAVLSAAYRALPLDAAAHLGATSRALPPDRAHRARFGVCDWSAPYAARSAHCDPALPTGPGGICPRLQKRMSHAMPNLGLDVVATGLDADALPAVPQLQVTDSVPALHARRLRATPAALAALACARPDLRLSLANPRAG
jgi:subtilisin family serine protease